MEQVRKMSSEQGFSLVLLQMQATDGVVQYILVHTALFWIRHTHLADLFKKITECFLFVWNIKLGRNPPSTFR